MAGQNRVGNWATAWLLIALALALAGLILQRTGVSPFAGGLISAFGEAALIGGLADWFAVRALFGHPLGIRIFPHTAIIPRNRRRIVKEVRDLVQNEWLPKEMLTARVQAFDFVGDGLLSTITALKPKLRAVVRTVTREVLRAVSPEEISQFLARVAKRPLEAKKVAPFLADLVRRGREERWLEPLLGELVGRFRSWAASPENKEVIYRHLFEAAGAYRKRGTWKDITMSVAEMSGGIDLKQAAELLQHEITKFAEEQIEEESHLHLLVQDALRELERRLLDEPEFLNQLQQTLTQENGTGSLHEMLRPVVTSLKQEWLHELDREDSPFLSWGVEQLQVWVDRLAQDQELHDRLNGWCRRTVSAMIVKHHSLIGAMVEDRLNRFSDENLTSMIEAKVGEDLNWIRINGSLVGGMVGVLLYLLLSASEAMLFNGFFR
jgi:uncharacterized membrane-anchored protein YjiN (DUF445 family)